MAFIQAGKVLELVIIVLIGASIYVLQRMISNKKLNLSVRRLSQIDAIDEAVGRAVEMGRPVHYSYGCIGLSHPDAPSTIAGVMMLDYVSHLTAKLGAQLIASCPGQSDVLPLLEETISNVYLMEGVPEEFKSDTIRFFPPGMASTSGVSGLIVNEKVGANIMIGTLWHRAIIWSENANSVGAMQITGTAETFQIPFLVATSDYCLIGEDIFAAGAYATKEPPYIASVTMSDYSKFIAIALIIIGAILSTLNNTAILEFLKI